MGEYHREKFATCVKIEQFTLLSGQVKKLEGTLMI